MVFNFCMFRGRLSWPLLAPDSPAKNWRLLAAVKAQRCNKKRFDGNCNRRDIVLQPEKTCESFPKPFQKVEAFPNLQNFQNPVAMESTSVPASPDASASAAPVAVAPRKPHHGSRWICRSAASGAPKSTCPGPNAPSCRWNSSWKMRCNAYSWHKRNGTSRRKKWAQGNIRASIRSF